MCGAGGCRGQQGRGESEGNEKERILCLFQILWYTEGGAVFMGGSKNLGGVNTGQRKKKCGMGSRKTNAKTNAGPISCPAPPLPKKRAG